MGDRLKYQTVRQREYGEEDRARADKALRERRMSAARARLSAAQARAAVRVASKGSGSRGVMGFS